MERMNDTGRYVVENGRIHDMENPMTVEEAVKALNDYEDKLLMWLYEKNLLERIIMKEEEIIRIMDKRNRKLSELVER